jgi:outer membrane receptor protein involved in Fe transport
MRLFSAILFASTLLRAAAQTSTPTPVSLQQSITVTADRCLANINDSATSTAVLTEQQLQQSPGLALDDSLHQIAGFQLFRRTSSWTANPTSAGISLRGLGSTAASRTLVISDQVPLSDPFGAWVHWNETPTLAIDHVQLLRGGGADLYGSSAIGGVIDLVPLTPTKLTFAADTFGATENTGAGDALLTTANRHLATLAALSILSTGGYVPTAPAARGTIDTVSNVTSQSARTEFHVPLTPTLTAFLRGNLLNESRANGTPDQTNGTRLWRYIGGADSTNAFAILALRLYGSRESYRQSFSSIAANRDSETLTKLQHVPTDELGFAFQASRAFPHAVTTALGIDLRDIRATDDETATPSNVTTSTSARQRETGGYADAIWQPTHWSFSGSIRVDSFRTFDALKTVSSATTITPQPNITEPVASPHLGIVRNLPHGLTLTATAFRAFRGPTMNELYRTGQVGSQTTLANNALLAERATGFETGVELSTRVAHVRATYFWTEVNRPITTVLVTETATTQTLQRQNLGQLRSDGIMLEAQTTRWHVLDATFNYQLAIATVTRFNSSSTLQANLVGNWLPEVPRESFTSAINYTAARIAAFHLIASYQGREFDDSANQYLLHPYARVDLLAERSLTRRLSVFGGAQNLLNRSIQAGLTPTPTLAPPRLVQGGLRFRFSR